MRRSLTFALVLVAATNAWAATDTIRRNFNVAAGGTLHLDAAYGDVKIVSGGNGVSAEIVRTARGRRADEQLAEHKVSFSQNGDDVTITSSRNKGWDNFFNDFDVQWNIRIPSTYSIVASTSGGSIDLANIGGTVDVETSGGGIKTGKITGQAKLDTSGGDIDVAGGGSSIVAKSSGGSITIGDVAGRVEARTSGGAIELAHVSGDVIAHTSGGGISIEDATGSIDAHTSGGSIDARLSAQPRGDSRFDTSGGGVTITIARGLSFNLDARASGGGVNSSVPVTILGTHEDDELSGTINGGGPKLVLRSSGGGINLRQM